jgi:hypothetical protein
MSYPGYTRVEWEGHILEMDPSHLVVDGVHHRVPDHDDTAKLLGVLAYGDVLEVGYGFGHTHRLIRSRGHARRHVLVEKFPPVLDFYNHPDDCGCEVVIADIFKIDPWLSFGQKFDTIIVDLGLSDPSVLNGLANLLKTNGQLLWSDGAGVVHRGI